MRQRIVHVCFVPLSNIGLPLIETKKKTPAQGEEKSAARFWDRRATNLNACRAQPRGNHRHELAASLARCEFSTISVHPRTNHAGRRPERRINSKMHKWSVLG